jgi:hypothetical protein
MYSGRKDAAPPSNLATTRDCRGGYVCREGRFATDRLLDVTRPPSTPPGEKRVGLGYKSPLRHAPSTWNRDSHGDPIPLGIEHQLEAQLVIELGLLLPVGISQNGGEVAEAVDEFPYLVGRLATIFHSELVWAREKPS